MSENGENNNGNNNDAVELDANNQGDQLEGELREDRLMSYMDLKFSEMKDENESLKRKLKCQEEKTTKFKHKGHEKQYEFNLDIKLQLEGVVRLITQQRTTKATAEIAEAIEKLEKRNKYIRIADRSPYGWKTVAEYQSDQLAENPDDEKRIKNSEKLVAKKEKEASDSKEKVRSKVSFGNHPYQRTHGQSSSTITKRGSFQSNRTNQPTGTTTTYRHNQGSSYGTGNGYGQTSRFRSAYNPNSYQQGSSQCFECGEPDHFWRQCPYR